MLERFDWLINRPNGLVLVTGPTGSGKTTTLYGALNELNTPEKKIITVEDPVEYQLERINQVQVMSKIGFDFARVLRSTLRQDPDILLVGEIRDAETAEIALRAAMTGHLVLSTLHTNDAISSALRLIDIGIEGYMVAASVRAIVAQRLIRKLCDRCSVPYQPDSHELAWLQATASGLSENEYTFSKGKGCNQCNRTGYFGRLGVFELLEIDGDMADALRADDTALFSRLANAQPKFAPLVKSALELAVAGETSLAEVMALSGQEEELWEAEHVSLEDTLLQAHQQQTKPSGELGLDPTH